MAKEKMTVTVDAGVFADVDADAREDGLNRSEYVERALRNEHYRRLFARVEAPAPLRAEDDQRLRDLLAWQQNPQSTPPTAAAS